MAKIFYSALKESCCILSQLYKLHTNPAVLSCCGALGRHSSNTISRKAGGVVLPSGLAVCVMKKCSKYETSVFPVAFMW